MAGVLEQLRRSRREPIRDNVSSAKIDQKALELKAAMEILAEVFGTSISEIGEMLRLRYQECLEIASSCSRRKQGQSLLKHGCSELDEWPLEFCITE